MKYIVIALIIFALIAPCMAYENKYVDTNPLDDYVNSIDSKVGTIRDHVRCGMNTITSQIGIRNKLSGENGSFMFTPVKPDGTFEEMLITGEFEACAFNDKGEFDGNGGQKECSDFTIEVNQVSKLKHEILGHAVSSGDEKTCKNLEIISAKYGMLYQESVIDKPEHKEYRYWILEAGHYIGNGHNKKWVVDISAHWSEWSDIKPHYYYQERTVEATYKIITSGQYIDVTNIVNNLKTCEGLKIIADYPNLHYNELFTDPTPNVFKNFNVVYKINGIQKSTTVKEDVDLNI